jgi:hypothetical protein
VTNFDESRFNIIDPGFRLARRLINPADRSSMDGKKVNFRLL